MFRRQPKSAAGFGPVDGGSNGFRIREKIRERSSIFPLGPLLIHLNKLYINGPFLDKNGLRKTQ